MPVPPAGGVTGDIDAGFHHQPGFHQRVVQLIQTAPYALDVVGVVALGAVRGEFHGG